MTFSVTVYATGSAHHKLLHHYYIYVSKAIAVAVKCTTTNCYITTIYMCSKGIAVAVKYITIE